VGVELRKPSLLDRAAEEGVLDDGQAGTDTTKAGTEFGKMLDIHPAVFDDDQEGRVCEAFLKVLYNRGFLGAHGGSP
jgi:hypothetical protein